MATFVSSRALSVRHRELLVSLLKCILLTVILATSTGTNFRKLLYVTFSDITALIVATIWALGDILPSISLLVLINDIFIVQDREELEILSFKGQRISLLDIIVILFILLYSADFILTGVCYAFTYRGKESVICDRNLFNYRYIFFHIQVFIAICYLAKPWNWNKLDLRSFLTRFERLNLLLYKIAHSLLRFLDASRRVEEGLDPRTGESSIKRVIDSSITSSRSSRSQEPNLHDTASKQTFSQRNSRRGVYKEIANNQPVSGSAGQNRRNRARNSTRLRRTTSTTRRITNERQRRSESTRTTLSSRASSVGSRSSTRQAVVVRVGPPRRVSRASKALKSVTSYQDLARTVNLNLNVN